MSLDYKPSPNKSKYAMRKHQKLFKFFFNGQRYKRVGLHEKESIVYKVCKHALVKLCVIRPQALSDWLQSVQGILVFSSCFTKTRCLPFS